MYRRLMGKLLYLTLTGLDISYVVGHLIQFISKPKVSHLQVAQRILKYLKRVPGKGLFFRCSYELWLIAFTDSD